MENATIFDATAGIIQATAKVTIKNLVEVMSLYKPGKDFISDTFNVGDTPMAIQVYPNGVTDEHRGHMGIFLRNMGDAAVTVKANFITDTCEWENEDKEMVVEPESGMGLNRFLSHAECMDAYKDKDIADISHHCHYRRWCTFFKPTYFFPQRTQKEVLLAKFI